MMPDPIKLVIDHPAPMAIRWGRGNGLGLFAVRAQTAVEIPGADPRDLAAPADVPPGVPAEVRIHARRLWIPVEALGRGGIDRRPASLDAALRHLSEPPRGHRATDAHVIGLDTPPFKTPYGFALYHARAVQDSGLVPKSARAHVEAARHGASQAVAEYAGTRLLHVGDRLYRRLPVPMISPYDTNRASIGNQTGLHHPAFLASRIGPGGRLPYGGYANAALEPLAARLATLLAEIDVADEDIDGFLAGAPDKLVQRLRTLRTSAAETLQERLFPLLVAGARAGVPDMGRDAAAEAIKVAARAILDSGRAGSGIHAAHATAVLTSYVAFVDRVVRPALSGPTPAEDEDSIGALAP